MYNVIQEKLETAATTSARWKTRYEEDGLQGLATFHPGQSPRLLTPELRAKI
jgi:transposase